jgi:hypothetical protein
MRETRKRFVVIGQVEGPGFSRVNPVTDPRTGIVERFRTHARAQLHADDLTAAHAAYTAVTFRYWVDECDGFAGDGAVR